MPNVSQQRDRDKKKEREWRDKPVEQEGDKDIKEGGIAGARGEQGKEDRGR